jgi:enoyl-CoA hydratase/carnithine racemase
MYEQILYDVSDPVATVTLNRPERLNAHTPKMGAEMRDAVNRASRDKRVVGIVVTGAGRGFCAGADMGVLSSLTSSQAGSEETAGGEQATVGESEAEAESSRLIREQPVGDASWGPDLQGYYTYLMSVPKPIVAAINGPVAGMAVPLVLSCDLRFMASHAVLTTSFSQRGLIAEWGMAWMLPRLVGSATALDVLFSSRKVTGTECAAMGLVNKALPVDEVVPAAVAYIEELARTVSPTSLAVIKRQVYQQLHAGLGPAEIEARELMVESFGRPDFGEGVASFLEKRPPSFLRIGEDG